MSVSNNKNSYNSSIYSAVGTGLIGGTAVGLSVYDSKPWLKNGVPSDSFVKKVEEKILKSSDAPNLDLQKALMTYLDDIDKSKSYGNIADAGIRFFTRISKGKTLPEIRSLLQQDIMGSLRSSMGSLLNIDESLDYYNSVGKASTLQELKSAMVDYMKAANAGFSFGEAKDAMKAVLNQVSANGQALNLRSQVKEAIASAYDFTKAQFVKESDEISADMLELIKKTAKSMQSKAGLIWGLVGGAAFGSAMYLINSLTAKTVKSSQKPAPKTQNAAPDSNITTKNPKPSEIQSENLLAKVTRNEIDKK